MRISDWSSDVCSSDLQGRPRRIDHAFSWAYPLSAHGMMHTLIRNAHAGDPYRIDTLLMFMANMSWNSAMNTRETMQWLTDQDEAGGYRIPRIIYSDALEIGRASCRDRGCQNVSVSGVSESLKKTK